MIRRELAGWVRAGYTGPSCRDLIGFLHDAVLTARTRNELRTVTASSVSITGDTAKVRMNGIFWLTKTPAGWRISEVPLAA